MIGAQLLDELIAAPFAFVSAFLRSPARQRQLDRWDTGAGTYAPPIVHDHQEWPGAGAAHPHQEWPWQPWPGARS